MRITLVIVVLLVLWRVGAFAESRPPQPIPPQKITTTLRQNTDTNHNGTNRSPLVLRILPPGKGKDEAANNANEKKDKTFNDKILVIFTFGF